MSFDGIPTLDDVAVKGKTLLMRIDLNSSLDSSGKIIDNPRFDSHAITLNELISNGAKIVLLAHQGRPGDKEFRSLAEHAQLMGEKVGRTVEFVPDVAGPTAIEAIKSLNECGVILLENVRFLAEEMVEKTPEEHSKDYFVQKLASVCDVFVNDAFSMCHRSHASTVGFTPLLPSFAGRALQRELQAADKLMHTSSRPCVFLLGGVKFKETLDIIAALCKRNGVDHILTMGALSLLLLKAKGINLGEDCDKHLSELGGDSFMPVAKQLVDRYRDKIATPLDVAVEVDGKRKEYFITDLPVSGAVKDIGQRTAAAYGGILKNCNCVFAKGAAGEFEDAKFSGGTKSMCRALSESTAFTVVAGGSLPSAFELFAFDKSKITHFSTAGGALLEYLAGNKLPGVEALRKS